MPYMTGPQHYRAAQRLLDSIDGKTVPIVEVNAIMAAAQVNATLALAAATVTGALTDVAVSGDIEVGPGTWHDILTGGAS